MSKNQRCNIFFAKKVAFGGFSSPSFAALTSLIRNLRVIDCCLFNVVFIDFIGWRSFLGFDRIFSWLLTSFNQLDYAGVVLFLPLRQPLMFSHLFAFSWVSLPKSSALVGLPVHRAWRQPSAKRCLRWFSTSPSWLSAPPSSWVP